MLFLGILSTGDKIIQIVWNDFDEAWQMNFSLFKIYKALRLILFHALNQSLIDDAEQLSGEMFSHQTV